VIRIDPQPWHDMLAHARAAYPHECCGAMLGSAAGAVKVVSHARPLENVYPGAQHQRYELRPEDLLAVAGAARERGLTLIGIYHSHPDADAYFSATDLGNSCPWYSFVVLSIRGGEFDHARSWLPNAEQTAAEPEELVY
jgi:proteasome lid subunit RPN8/RPN11